MFFASANIKTFQKPMLRDTEHENDNTEVNSASNTGTYVLGVKEHTCRLHHC